jgi:ferredoxin-thioredoxin reductase catalytic subunit
MSSSIPQSLQAMQKFSETYAQRTGTFFCSDLSITAVVIEGLARHKDEYGAPLCPCRHYDDKPLKFPQHIGIAPAYQCANVKNVIVCYF